MNENIKIKGMVTVSVKRTDGREELICENKPNLLTDVGRDWFHTQVYNTGTTDAAKYIALTSDTTAPDVSDITLASEIVANGLERKQGTPAHTTGTNITSIVTTFTATNTFTAVQKSGLFTTAVSGGVMVHENIFAPVNLESGDQLTVTWTITAG
jgi:hypothetical protein